MVALLDIERVTKIFSGRMGVTRAVHDLSMVLGEKPKLVSVAGESGSGKSTLALMVLGFLKPTSGAIRYKGLDIHASGAVGAETFRREVQAVFQNPFEAFNPFYKIDHAFNLVIQKFRLARTKGERLDLVHGVLRTVQLEPGKILGRYPHEMSGGQLQRVSIARALLAKPKLLVADEPVSMIDASLRLRVLRHLVTLKEKYGVSIIYITHDLSTALQISDEVLIMHRGEVVERGDAVSVIQTPQHPYTKLLVESIPVADPSVKWVGVSKKYELLLETELTLIR
jgi:ABC-type oligopeptide transport system ATPase subunit